MWVLGYTDLIDGNDVVLGESDTFYHAVTELLDNVEKMAADDDMTDLCGWGVLIKDISATIDNSAISDEGADTVFHDAIGTEWYVMDIQPTADNFDILEEIDL